MRLNGRPSLYDHISRHLNPDRPGLLPGGEKLPDTPPIAPDEIQYAGGALEHLIGPGGSSQARIDQLMRELVRASHSRTSLGSRRLAAVLATDDCLAHVDQLAERLAREPELRVARLRQVAREILITARTRGALKYAIALVGWLGSQAEVPLVAVVGRHPEFTLYASVALANLLGDPIPVWFNLAKQTTEWARVDLVTRLCNHPVLPRYPEVREWLLTEAALDYLVAIEVPHLIAEKADFLALLREGELTPRAFNGAVTLLKAMVVGGAEERSPTLPESLHLFLGHARSQRHDLDLVSLLLTLRSMVARGDKSLSADASLAVQLAGLIGTIDMGTIALEGRDSPDEHAGWLARSVARSLGLDWSDYLRARVLNAPNDLSRWQDWLSSRDEVRLRDALNLLPSLLPIGQWLTGPDRSLGLGQVDRRYELLATVAAPLADFPGLGAEFLASLFRCPVTRTRRVTLRVLQSWASEHWTAGLREAVRSAAMSDPEGSVRAAASELLKERFS